MNSTLVCRADVLETGGRVMNTRPMDSVGLLLVGMAVAIAWKLQVLTLALVLGIPLALFGAGVNAAIQRQAENRERRRVNDQRRGAASDA